MTTTPSRSAVAALALTGCLTIDEPNPIAPPGSTTDVRWLSELGVFADLAAQLPADGFVPFEPNVPLYSDAAEKQRFVYVPPGERLGVAADRWAVPVGAYLVKTFAFPRDARRPELGERRIETRFLVREGDGFRASTYVWNDAQTDAEVSGGNVNVPIEWIDRTGVAHSGTFHVPGTSQCEGCHFDRALGMRSAQMARTLDGTDQIDRLVAAGVLDGTPDDRTPWPDPYGTAALETRARAYLAANCGHCHSRDGDGEATVHDVLWDFPDTAERLPLCKPTAAVDGRDRVIVPGHPERSELIARMWSRDPFVRMPRGANHVPDGAGIALLTEWIASLPAQECP